MPFTSFPPKLISEEMNRRPVSGETGFAPGPPVERGSLEEGASGGEGRSEPRVPELVELDDWALTSPTPTSKAVKVANTLQMFRILFTLVSIYETHRARDAVLANYHVGFDQPFASININRHPHRHQRRARDFNAHCPDKLRRPGSGHEGQREELSG